MPPALERAMDHVNPLKLRVQSTLRGARSFFVKTEEDIERSITDAKSVTMKRDLHPTNGAELHAHVFLHDCAFRIQAHIRTMDFRRLRRRIARIPADPVK